MITTLFGQLDDNYSISFDNQYGMQHLFIDTISNPNNIWQVGQPQKTVFSSAYTEPNAIITDSINSYPPNDTSIFMITNVASGQGYEWPHTVVLAGRYYVNSDTIVDYGKIEFSPDNGTTWVDMLNDTVIIDTASNWTWIWPEYDKPVLTGNSDQWKYFNVNLAVLGHFYGVQDGDTVLFKFTFISDNIQTNKDGLMFDDLYFEDYVEEIEEENLSQLNSICFPNPAQDHIIIKSKAKDNGDYNIAIFDITGKQVFKKEYNNVCSVELNICSLNAGYYFYQLTNEENKTQTIGKFIKE
jgi:hypothetical protein